MQSIRSRLLAGLAISGLIGGSVLVLLVTQQYGLLTGHHLSTTQTLHEIFDHVVLPVGVFLTLFGIGAFLVVRDLERKLRATARQVSLAAGSLQAYQAPVETLPTELRPYVTAVNDLILQLSRHAERQEAFAADAAHELKTPLALLALELDKLPEHDTRRLQEYLTALSDMIDQLLLLARSNVTEIAKDSRMIDPVDLGRRIVEDMAPAAIGSGRSLSFETHDPSSFPGLEEAVGAAVRTLVTNALRATPEGGNVSVIAGPGACITVSDGGSGLDAATLKKLKARGVRADIAPGGAAGLGLAIADRIAESHGGELQTCLPETTGLKLIFPEHPGRTMPAAAE